MKKTLLIGTFLVLTACFTLPMAMAQPAGPVGPGGPQFKQPPKQERILPKPKFEDFLLNNTELKLTDKQKKEITKTSKATDKKVKKLDIRMIYIKQNRKAKEDKRTAIDDNFRTIQNILTDEQKEILKNQQKQKMEERKAKFEEFKKAHPNFKKRGKRPHHPMRAKCKPQCPGEKGPQSTTK